MLLVALLGSPAGAWSAPTPDPDEAVTFTPAFVLSSVRAGQRTTIEIIVQNQTQAPVDLVLERTDLIRARNGGTSTEYVPLGTAPRGAGSWLQVPYPTLHLAAGRQQAVRFPVLVPADAGAGGHYAGVVFTLRQIDPDTQIRIDHRTEIPVLFTVAGDFQRDLRVHVAPDASWRWRGGKATWRIRLENRGDVHENVSGTLRIAGLLGGDRTIRLDTRILLPGDRTTQPVQLDLRDAPERYASRARVQLDRHGPVTAVGTTVTVLPWWLLVLLVAAIAVVAWRLRTRREQHHPRDVEFDRADGPAIGPAE